MLTYLLIKNYALIDHLELSPSPYLNIITGETGAGKSIMLGAVGLLLGNRADSKSLLNENEKCIIEGHFDLSSYSLQKLFEEEDIDFETTTIIRREIKPGGKSRAFVNDTPTTLHVLKKLGSQLMDIHSQHDSLNLGNLNFQLAFIDAFAGTTPDRKRYAAAFKTYKSEEKALNQLKEQAQEMAKEADYNHFLFEELEKAELRADEQDELEEQVKIAEHAEEIKGKLNELLAVASQEEFSALNAMQQIKTILKQLSKFADKYERFSERTESVFIEFGDIINELEKEEGLVEFDPEETQRLQDRLSMIYSLQQKHGVSTIQELMNIHEELATKVLKVSSIDDEIDELEKKVASLKSNAFEQAQELSKKRQKAFSSIANQLIELLQKVGIPDASISIDSTTIEMESHGIDKVEMLFSANKGIAPQPVNKVASGGEYSRLMFCVKYILAAKIALPTIIFDEIDTGVSGEVALKLGTMMKEMARNHQVIAISHLPQIAAKGDSHYFVYKDSSDAKSVSRIRPLDEQDRITEIAKMIGGDQPSDTAFDSARELIQTN